MSEIRCIDCNAVLNEEKIKYYGASCENCERKFQEEIQEEIQEEYDEKLVNTEKYR